MTLVWILHSYLSSHFYLQKIVGSISDFSIVSAMRFSCLAITVVSISSVSAFSGVGTSPTKLQYTFLKMSSEKKQDELVETGNKLSHPGYVHSARDHSTGSVDARVQSVGAEDIEEKRAEVCYQCHV